MPTPKAEGGAWLHSLGKASREEVYTMNSWSREQLHSLPGRPWYITTGRKPHSLGPRNSFFHEGLNNRNLSKEQKQSRWSKTYDTCFNWTIKTSHSAPKTDVSKSAPSTISRRRWLLSESCWDSHGSWSNTPEGLRNLLSATVPQWWQIHLVSWKKLPVVQYEVCSALGQK